MTRPPFRRLALALAAALALVAPPAKAHEDPSRQLRARERLVDLSLATGFPESLGACAQWHPIDLVELEGCGGITRDIRTLGQALKLRFDLWNTRGNDGIGLQGSLAPMVGLRQLWTCPIGQGCGFAAGLDYALSFEHVWWTAPHFGWSLEADFGLGLLGTRVLPRLSEVLLSPVLRLQLGLAF